MLISKTKILLFLGTILSILFQECEKSSSGKKQGNEEQNSLLTELRQAISPSISIASINISDTTFHNANFSLNADNVLKDPNSIVIFLDIDTVTFKNNTNIENESDLEKYDFMGAEKSSGLYWIVKTLYEEQKNLIVSREGKIYEVSNEPKINKASTLLFSMQSDCFLVFEDCSPGFKIWTIKNGSLELFDHVKLKNYYVKKGGWIANDKLLIEVSSITSLTNKSIQSTNDFFILTLK